MTRRRLTCLQCAHFKPVAQGRAGLCYHPEVSPGLAANGAHLPLGLPGDHAACHRFYPAAEETTNA